MTQKLQQETIPNAQLAGICQNSQQETDNDLPKCSPLDPTVSASGLTTSQQLQYSRSSSVQAASNKQVNFKKNCNA